MMRSTMRSTNDEKKQWDERTKRFSDNGPFMVRRALHLL